MARLLVSVRSAAEAIDALAGGAEVIDVKEPARGPLGRANALTWHAVRAVVPPRVPVSVALGELMEWCEPFVADPAAFHGLTYRKLGLAGAPLDWRVRWDRLRAAWGTGPAWIAVAYADWELAHAPHPDAVIDAAAAAGCAGVLLDTWTKNQGDRVDRSCSGWVARARSCGLSVALAGGLDEIAIEHLADLRPDLFAVRGAACRGGDRRNDIDRERVARLARVVASITSETRACST